MTLHASSSRSTTASPIVVALDYDNR
ncbi:MAG TPA: orotidine-5'-phosphate decarboxylase, partial [Enterobacteriaceae bacterium]|nr:orotidine-5'-phosphate decarboxylase [Enterobacteriaceae bacterium]